MAGMAQETSFVMVSTLCSIPVADFVPEPCHKFRVTKFSVLFSYRASDLEHTFLFREVSHVS